MFYPYLFKHRAKDYKFRYIALWMILECSCQALPRLSMILFCSFT